MRCGDVVAGRFEVGHLAGSGGMASVWRAEDLTTGDAVALKALTRSDDEDSERFEGEAALLASLSHAAIVRYIAHGTTAEGELYLAMEWLEGWDLDARLSKGPLGVHESVVLVTRVAEALREAHGRGIIHRDIKPANVWLVDGDVANVKLIDFGLARERNLARSLTRTGIVVGTPGYMAPEQARGGAPLDARADVFGLGCVLFECLTGTPCFRGESLMAVLAKILVAPTPSAADLRPEVPPACDELLARLLAKEPDDRPASMDEVLALLADLRAATVVPPAPEGASHGDDEEPGSLTGLKQRLVCVIFAGTLASMLAVTSGSAATLFAALVPVDALREAAAPYAGRVEALANGSVIVTLLGVPGTSAIEQAGAAARCALAVRAVLPQAPMALVTGRGDVSGGRPVSEVIDRCAQLVGAQTTSAKEGQARPVALDPVTSGLLAPRFDVGPGAGGLVLLGERDAAPPVRTLLGRPSPCVGRDREIASLLAVVDDCSVESAARAVVLVGPAGAGKTRICHELLRAVEGHADVVCVLAGRGDPMSASAPFGLLAPALRRAAPRAGPRRVGQNRRGPRGGRRGAAPVARAGVAVTDPTWRRAFLTQVPENARILDLALALCGGVTGL